MAAAVTWACLALTRNRAPGWCAEVRFVAVIVGTLIDPRREVGMDRQLAYRSSFRWKTSCYCMDDDVEDRRGSPRCRVLPP